MIDLVTSSDFAVRAASTDDEVNYVRKTWLREHEAEGTCSERSELSWVNAHGGREVYLREHKPCLERAIARGAITIAYRPSVPSGICGFAVTECELVHFVYVKPRWRTLGVARLLLQPLLIQRAEYTHRTRMLRLLPLPEAWTFNPYPFMRIE